MNLWESLKKSFTKDNIELKNISNDPDTRTSTKVLSDDPYGGSIIINGAESQSEFQYDYNEIDKFEYQNKIIKSYRELANNDDVSNCVDILINEIVYTVDDDVFKISINEENEKIKDVINKSFEKVLGLLNIRENMYNISRQMYIDGQLNVSLGYIKGKVKDGIKTANIIEPMNLYFDTKNSLWKYNQTIDTEYLYGSGMDIQKVEFSESEMVHIDYDLYTKIQKESELPFKVNLGYLENVFKSANMLRTLENMLVPLRYSRSVSRRLFNIDVADLPPKQAKALMDKIRAEFRYKKSYNTDDGTITNIKSQQPLVEDYWMSNRSGGKGTTVETMDEAGGLMDLEDIRLAATKLYTAMKVPTSRNPYSDDQATFSFESTEITQEEMSFYIFINRIRIPLTNLIKQILRRELVATGVFLDSEWKSYEQKIEIQFTAAAVFLENMKKDLFMKNIEAFAGIKENIGEVISLSTAVENTFGWSTEQLDAELEKIKQEQANRLYDNFYERDQELDGESAW